MGRRGGAITHIIRRDRTDQQLCDRETIRACSEEFLHLKRHALRESLLGKRGRRQFVIKNNSSIIYKRILPGEGKLELGVYSVRLT